MYFFPPFLTLFSPLGTQKEMHSIASKRVCTFLKTSFYLIQEEIKGLSNVEKVLLDTADSVMDTKKKLEFGVQQIIFKVINFFVSFLMQYYHLMTIKVGELVKVSGGQMDDQLKDKFEDITRTILSNQTEALANLTTKVEKEIGQVWRQMGIVYGQVKQ